MCRWKFEEVGKAKSQVVQIYSAFAAEPASEFDLVENLEKGVEPCSLSGDELSMVFGDSRVTNFLLSA